MRKISELWSVGWSFSFFMVTNRSVVLCYSKVKGVAPRDALLGYNNNYLRTKNDADLSPVEGLFRPSTVRYRVNSQRGIAFRKWANDVLKQYILKGYAINEKRLQALKKTVDIQSRMLADALDIEEKVQPASYFY